MRRSWMIGAMCAWWLAPPTAAAAQAGVLVRGLSDQAHCSPGGEHTSIEGSCAELPCDPGRVCVPLDGVGARCIDPSQELVCVLGTDCEACPPNLSTGADAEGCRVVVLPEGRHVVCVYSSRLACLLEDGVDLDPLACLPPTENEPSLAAGDCDMDGVANAEDTCVCERGTGPSCLPLDGGAPDAGAPDGGRDAGGADAGTPGLDASMRDASPAPPPLSFRGGGGCACGATRGRGRGAPILLGFVLALAKPRRRTR